VTDRTWSLTVVGQIFDVIPDLATPSQVQASLREILEDPKLEVFWWDWEDERYVDVRGAEAELGAADSHVVTRVDYESRKIGAIRHDRTLLGQPGFNEVFVPMIRIAMERDRLHRELVAKLDQLKASRLRLVQAAEEERRRLERNLHDGAQQLLVVTLLDLHRLERLTADDAQVGPLAQGARRQLEGAIEELRELARGLHPPLLTEHGLEAALRAGAARSSLPVQLDLHVGEGVPPDVEAAAYYVCAEAVTNAVKHARSSAVSLSVLRENGTLVVEVCDDGVGGAAQGAHDRGSTGLTGLRDRVEALEGTLDVHSPPGQGTRLTARFPL
jgi:signal transduction histidine kinase